MDDTGDPGKNGSLHFGYALIAVEHDDMEVLVRLRATFRVDKRIFREQKASPGHRMFRPQIESLREIIREARAIVGAAMICKPNYQGPYLVGAGGLRADANRLRGYVLRHALELAFDGTTLSSDDSCEIVVDRVDMSDEQVHALRRYLSGHHAEHAFGFPKPTHVTHADSLYVEGLQMADHLARLAHRIAADADAVNLHILGASFLPMKTIRTSRDADRSVR